MRDTDASAYLLLGLFYLQSFQPAEEEILRRLEGIPSLGIKMAPLTIRFEDKLGDEQELSRGNHHFVFTLRNGERDDACAQRCAEAIQATLTLVYEPSLLKPLAVLRVPRSLAECNFVTFEELRADCAPVGRQYPLNDWELRIAVGSGSLLPGEVLATVFDFLPATTMSPYFEAVHYYEASTSDYSIDGASIAEVLSNISDGPVSKADATRAEDAVQNAFKAVEALIGEPPTNDEKLRRKLKEIGVNPEEPAGLQWHGKGPEKEPLTKKVRTLQALRDKKAAHAKTRRGAPLTYHDVMDAQGCAQTIVLIAVQHELEAAP